MNDSSIVIKSRFVTSKNKDWTWMTSSDVSFKSGRSKRKGSYKSHVDYAGRETECSIEKMIPLDSKKKGPLSYADYISQEFKVTSKGHFTRDKDLVNEEQFKEWSKQNPISKETPVWDMVVSFGQDYFTKNEIFTKEKASKIINNSIDQFFRMNNMNPEALAYIGQFHVDKGHHFHIHLRVHQKEASMYSKLEKKDIWRTRGKFFQQSFESWKSKIDFEVQKENIRFIGINDQRNKVKYNVLNSLSNPAILQSVMKEAKEIKERLPEGRMQYNAIKSPVTKYKVKALTLKIINSSDESRKGYASINDLIDERIKKALKQQGSGEDNRSRRSLKKLAEIKKEEVISHFANQILKKIKTLSVEGKGPSKNERINAIKHIANKRTGFVKHVQSKKTWNGVRNSIDDSITKEAKAILRLYAKNKAEVEWENDNERL